MIYTLSTPCKNNKQQMILIGLQFEQIQRMSGDDDGNLQFLAADALLYSQMQAALNKQYRDAQEKLQLEYQEVSILRKNIQKSKEEVGVRLYTSQQQLAANQMDYEKAHDNFNIAQRLRVESEQKLAQVNELYLAKKDETNVLKNKVTKAQKQLENLMRHYHQIQAYNIQLKSDIAVTKIQTFTAEDNVTNLQKIKKKQDLLIDSMNQEAKRLEEQKNILSAQIISQKEETQEAKKVLKEAESEMEKVIASKKNLLERWEKSIKMMQKRDSAVLTLKQRLDQNKQKLALLYNELSGLKNELRKEQDVTQQHSSQSYKISKIRNNLQNTKKQLHAEKQKVSAQLFALKDSLGKTQIDIRAASLQQKAVQQSMNLIQTNIMKLHTETKKLLQSLIDQKSEHTTIQKTASNLVKQAYKLQLQSEQKQIALEDLLNEIARVRIDQLNTKSQIQLLKQRKTEALAEQEEKRYLAITYDVQIKQGHDINEKKQHQVGRLNKQHDLLMSKANDEGKNTDQNKLLNMERETEQLENKSNELYREWIKKQTLLVHENNTLQLIRETVTNLENKKTIMEQKKSRLNGNFQAFQKEIAEITINLKGLQQEMNKLNDSIAVNGDKKSKLENENVNLQSEFIEKLKEMERQAIRLQINIDKIREQKAQLMNEIVQCERQILLWQRKYQLEKQMQEAVDPNVGQTQIQELKKTLHRSELRFNSLLKEQDRIKAEALRAIIKKADIQLKHTASIKKEVTKKKDPETSNQLKNQMKAAKDNQTKIMKSLREVQQHLSKKEQDLQKIGMAVQQINEQFRDLETQNQHLETERVTAKIRKNLDVLKISTLQKKYKKLSQIDTKTASLMFSQPILRQKVTDIKQRNQELLEAVENLSNKYNQYSNLFDPVMEVATINSSVS